MRLQVCGNAAATSLLRKLRAPYARHVNTVVTRTASLTRSFSRLVSSLPPNCPTKHPRVILVIRQKAAKETFIHRFGNSVQPHQLAIRQLPIPNPSLPCRPFQNPYPTQHSSSERPCGLWFPHLQTPPHTQLKNREDATSRNVTTPTPPRSPKPFLSSRRSPFLPLPLNRASGNTLLGKQSHLPQFSHLPSPHNSWTPNALAK